MTDTMNAMPDAKIDEAGNRANKHNMVMVTPEQAAIVELAIANHRKAKKLMQDWEDETERLFDAEAPRKN